MTLAWLRLLMLRKDKVGSVPTCQNRLSGDVSGAHRLRCSRILATLSDDELTQLAASMKEKVLRAGDILWPEREVRQYVYFVLKGRLRITIMSPAGAHVTIRSVQP